MDDKDVSQQYSRGATFEDLIKLCQHLNELGARYVVIGGFAIIHYGYHRGTNDIDLLIDDSFQNIEKIKKALLFLPDQAIREVDAEEIVRYQVVRVADEIVVDLMTKACQVTYQEAEPHIEFDDIKGVKIPFLKPEILIQTKDTYRPRDKADKAYLEELIDRSKKFREKKPWWRW